MMTQATIMIVEDEGVVAMDMKTRLERYGYRVNVVVASGDLAVLRAAEQKPDLVIMDIMIKGSIDGVMAAAQIRKDHAIPIIYLTSYADPKTLTRAELTEP